MTATTSILPQKLHEYPQQDVIDASGGISLFSMIINQNDGVTTFTPLCRQNIL